MNIVRMTKKHRTRGFTLIEMLVTVVIIALLAALAVYAYNGIQQRARNAQRYQEAKSYAKLFSLYKEKYGTYPDIPSGRYCLGANFPDVTGDSISDCDDLYTPIYRGSTSAALNAALDSVGTVPSPTNRPLVDNYAYVGPVARYFNSGGGNIEVGIGIWLEGTSTVCPMESTAIYTNPRGPSTLCLIPRV